MDANWRPWIALIGLLNVCCVPMLLMAKGGSRSSDNDNKSGKQKRIASVGVTPEISRRSSGGRLYCGIGYSLDNDPADSPRLGSCSNAADLTEIWARYPRATAKVNVG